VDEFIGHGATADVYKVQDSKRAVTLAIKVLRPDLATDQTLLSRFSQEATLLEALNHPHIVRFYEWQRDGSLVFLVMDYVQGWSLRDIIKQRRKPFGLSEINYYVRPVSAALHYAHQKSVYHCDIKPSNILVGQDGGVFVSDFGVARIAAGASGLGTPTHMAPEQFEGGAVDGRTDIYALGVMLYELATGGHRPFSGGNLSSSGSTAEERLGWEHAHQTPPSPRQFSSAISPALETVILRSLEKLPQNRFSSTLELFDALQSAVSASNVLTAPRTSSNTATLPASGSSSRSMHNESIVPSPAARKPELPPARRTGPPIQHNADAYLLVRVGEGAGHWYPINNDGWMIGRSREAHLRFSSSKVSRRHAVIRKGRGYYYIQDMGSTLGTFVNGRKISGAHAIRSRDVIRVGDVELEFHERK
jgi:serine/threonine-protein kinase